MQRGKWAESCSITGKIAVSGLLDGEIALPFRF